MCYKKSNIVNQIKKQDLAHQYSPTNFKYLLKQNWINDALPIHYALFRNSFNLNIHNMFMNFVHDTTPWVFVRQTNIPTPTMSKLKINPSHSIIWSSAMIVIGNGSAAKRQINYQWAIATLIYGYKTSIRIFILVTNIIYVCGTSAFRLEILFLIVYVFSPKRMIPMLKLENAYIGASSRHCILAHAYLLVYWYEIFVWAYI